MLDLNIVTDQPQLEMEILVFIGRRTGAIRLHRDALSRTSRAGLSSGRRVPVEQVRIEVITKSAVAEQILNFISENIANTHNVSVCVETVEVNFHSQY